MNAHELHHELNGSAPVVFFLVGLPGVGKSTWISQHALAKMKSFEVISTDDVIANVSEAYGLSYDETFTDLIGFATRVSHHQARKYFAGEYDVIWDQTNLTRKSRAQKLSMVPSQYRKFAIYFPPPDAEEHARRLMNRPGKTIPHHVLDSMKSNVQLPSCTEGFERVFLYKNEEVFDLFNG